MAKPKALPYLELSRRPVYCLVFLAPLIIGYEIGALTERRTLLAEQMLRDLLTLSGRSFNFLSGLFVLLVMVGWQIASRESWRVRMQVPALMFAESVMLTLPLFLLHAVLPAGLSAPSRKPAATACSNVSTFPIVISAEPRTRLGDGPALPAGGCREGERSPPLKLAPLRSQVSPEPVDSAPRRLWRDVVISLGAGPYEELIFRLFLVELLLWGLTGPLKMDRQSATVIAVLISATLFAGYHYLPGTGEHFHWGSFLFRTGAGIYFSIVFVQRGYGVAAGCHTFYDVLVDLARAR